MPKVSIITICKNSGRFIEHCIQSVLEQNYPDLEYIVQDGASTDNTLEVLKKYSGKIKLVSELDEEFADGFHRALARVTGDIIGVILADARYRPGAISWAIKGFEQHPEAAVIYGDYHTINEHYDILTVNRVGAMSFDQIFCSERVVPLPASFIQTRLFKETGFSSSPGVTDCPEFEVWVKLGLKFPIQYIPGVVADFMTHVRAGSRQVIHYPTYIAVRRHVVLATIQDSKTPPSIKRLKNRAIAGIYNWAGDSVLELTRGKTLKWYTLAFFTQPGLKRLLKILCAILPTRLIKFFQTKGYLGFLTEWAEGIFQKLRRWRMRGINLAGDRDIEWSWIAANISGKDGRALDFGSSNTHLGLIAAQQGYEVTAVDLLPVQWFYIHPRLRYTQGDILKLYPSEQEIFDLVINCSTVEHVGLAGRYGVSESSPDGDLEAMAHLGRLMKPNHGIMLLTIPVGQDAVFAPLCRVYGMHRLPRLLSGFRIEKEEFWIKDDKNRWILCSKETALNFPASMGSWDSMRNVSGLGCFVLKRI